MENQKMIFEQYIKKNAKSNHVNSFDYETFFEMPLDQAKKIFDERKEEYNKSKGFHANWLYLPEIACAIRWKTKNQKHEEDINDLDDVFGV